MAIVLPCRRLNTVFHVGSMDIQKKAKLNFEGTNGLSVSTEPEAWRRINKGITRGDTFSLSNTEGVFIDANAMTMEQYAAVTQWATKEKLIYSCQQYVFSYLDDEQDEILTFYFDDYASAYEEAEGEHEVTLVDTHKGTSRFSKIVGETNIDNLSLLTVAYCLLETSHDGVFWDAEVDILRYQAPRGVILQKNLSRWKVERLHIDN